MMIVNNNNHPLQPQDSVEVSDFKNQALAPASGHDEVMSTKLKDMIIYNSPSAYAKYNSKGCTDAIPSYTTAIWSEVSGKTLSRVVGTIAHKAEEFLITSGKFETANSITDNNIITAVNLAFDYYINYENLEDVTILWNATFPMASQQDVVNYIDNIHASKSSYIALVLYLVKQFVNIFNTVPRKLESERGVQGEVFGKTFRGTADIIEHHDNGEVTIWDIKHYQEISERNLDSFNLQTEIYASCYEQTTGIKVTHTGVILPAQKTLLRSER